MAISSLPSGGGDDESDGIVAEINVTPLTDIFLVLLIIFMVIGMGVLAVRRAKKANETKDDM